MLHAKNSAKKYGGTWKDYIEIHDFLDSTKAHFPDMRHRAILHNSFGCYIAEKIFGHAIINSDNKEVCVRDIAEDHIIEDVGRIPTLQDYLIGMPMYPWLGDGNKKTPRQIINLD
jgi:hypothetical protein